MAFAYTNRIAASFIYHHMITMSYTHLLSTSSAVNFKMGLIIEATVARLSIISLYMLGVRLIADWLITGYIQSRVNNRGEESV